MALPVVTVPESDYSRGIDARSAENQIEPGFVADLLNAEIVGKRVRKRVGYQGFAGDLPIRITSVEYNDPLQRIYFTFSNAVIPVGIVPCPIVVVGRYATGPVTYSYYPTWTRQDGDTIYVEASVGPGDAGTYENPRMMIYGLSREELGYNEGYPPNLVDSYRAAGESRLVAAVQGNLHTAMPYSEVGATYLYGNLYPRLSGTVSGAHVLGPLFYETGTTPARTRGYITGTDSGTGKVRVTAVAYDEGTGYTDLTLEIPAKAVLNSAGVATTLSAVISTTAGKEDWVTLTDMSYARHNGTHRIVTATDGTDSLTLRVDLEDNSADYDDSGVYGFAGVYTDQITLSAASQYIPGDVLTQSSAVHILTVVSSLSTTVVVDGLTSLLSVPGSTVLDASRTSSVVPLRNASSATATGMLVGDMLSYTGIDRLLRIEYVNASADRTVSIAVPTATSCEVTLTSGTTVGLAAGAKVLLTGAGVYSGVVEIAEVTDSTHFTFVPTEDQLDGGAVTGATLQGYTVTLDEELPWASSDAEANVLQVHARWIVIDTPDRSTFSDYLYHDEYPLQNILDPSTGLRSTMVSDSLYLTDGDIPVSKYDGTSLYRAGLLPWQAGLFLTQDTSASAEIVISSRSVAYSASTAALGRATLAAGDLGVIPVGASVRISGSSQTYTVREYQKDGTAYYVFFDRALDSSVTAGAGTVSEIATYRYYFRLNAIDANGSTVASAVTGSQDHVIELTANAAVQIKAVGLPIWGIHNFSRIELEIYRTRQNQPAPFYRVTTVPLDLANGEGYVLYTDSLSDVNLIELDPVSTALLGTELGISWREPLRSRYTTSAAGSLVLGHVQDCPTLDIQLIGPASVTSSVFSGKRLLFRSNSSSTATTTDMVGTVGLEYVTSSTQVVSNPTFPVADYFQFDVTNGSTLSGGSWVYLYYTSTATTGRDLTYAGWWQVVEKPATNTIRMYLPGAAAASSYPTGMAIASGSTKDIPVFLGTDGNLGQVNGDSSSDLFDVMRRTSMALSASMRMVNPDINNQDTFTPWILARSGNDVARAGRLLVSSPRYTGANPEVVLPSAVTGVQFFVNGVLRSASQEVSASTRVYPSRLLVSYENYPEIFSDPTAVLDSESDSAIDVNSADGQEITGIIPFFGESAFGAAQKSGVVVVFKRNSIYLVDISEKRAGRPCVQRLQTRGIGCTAPASIAYCDDGIAFANEAGIYILRPDQKVYYLGKYIERIWQEEVDRDNLYLAQGHNYALGKQYKLSVPLLDGDSMTLVYDYSAEDEQPGLGAWSRYDNHPATGWTNLDSDAYFSTTSGRVMSLRRAGDETDFRDDSSAIQFRLETRALDFGNSGIRKVLTGLVAYYRSVVRSIGTVVSYAVDLAQEFRESTTIVLKGRESSELSGIDDEVRRDVVGIRHDTDRRRGTHFSVRIENGSIDEGVEVTGLDFRISGLSERGITQAQQTSDD